MGSGTSLRAGLSKLAATHAACKRGALGRACASRCSALCVPASLTFYPVQGRCLSTMPWCVRWPHSPNACQPLTRRSSPPTTQRCVLVLRTMFGRFAARLQICDACPRPRFACRPAGVFFGCTLLPADGRVCPAMPQGHNDTLPTILLAALLYLALPMLTRLALVDS